MENWKRDVLDHLVLMTVIQAPRPLSGAEIADEVVRYVPALADEVPGAVRAATRRE